MVCRNQNRSQMTGYVFDVRATGREWASDLYKKRTENSSPISTNSQFTKGKTMKETNGLGRNV